MADVPLFADLGQKQCARCLEIKPLESFPASLRPTGTVKFGSYCPPCQKAYQHEWYLAHRDEVVAKAAARRASERASRPRVAEPVPLPEAIGFRKHANPRAQGNAGLGVAIAYLTRVGVDVAIPLTDSQPYDLVIEYEGRLQRVQVKTTTQRTKSGVYVVALRTVGSNMKGVVRRNFDPGDYEWLFAVCGDATVYMIPTTAIAARTQLFLGRRYAAFRLED